MTVYSAYKDLYLRHAEQNKKILGSYLSIGQFDLHEFIWVLGGHLIYFSHVNECF